MAGPTKKPSSRLGSPPTEDSVTSIVGNNIEKTATGDTTPLNFKVSDDFKKDYRMFCLEHSLTMKDLLILSFDLYRKQKGGR